jgi:hypothetical protein
VPYKDIAKRREAHKRYYLKNKSLYITKNINRRKGLAKFVLELKQKPCYDCGVQYPHYVMDFDHTGKKEKLDSIARLARNGFSQKKILEEIEKCDLVCSNCHRERTHKRLIGK